MLGLLLGVALVGWPCVLGQNLSVCSRWDVYTVTITAPAGEVASVQPWLLARTLVTAVVKPAQGPSTTVAAFYDGGNTFVVRVYCGQPGLHTITVQTASRQLPSLHNRVYRFVVASSGRSRAVGKLRVHAQDPHQFQYDNGDWFLHVGDTGYRFLVPSEPEWRAYIDQAVRVMGATKIRTWFAQGRHDIAAALAPDKRSLNLGFWQEMDRRLVYVQTAFPWVQVQVIVYAEDGGAVSAAAAAAASPYAYVAEYAQARWSSFPIVQWCVVNDVSASVAVDTVGRAIAAREPWGTLITSHQRRGTGYAFARASWSRIVTLQTLDALLGREVASYRAVQRYPVVLEEVSKMRVCVRREALID